MFEQGGLGAILCHTWLASVLARGPAIFDTRAVGSNFGPRFVGDCFGQGAGYFERRVVGSDL